ncbi:MAG: carboxymuconolactone decarboxylase family protein [Halobacteriales archaeon]
MSDTVDDPETDLPSTAGDLAAAYPEVWAAYADLGEQTAEAGPLDGETKRLVKLGLAVGAGSEGAVHSHVRRAREEGVGREDIRHVALLAITTLGFPRAMAAMSWIEDVLED